ncbi:hypothetical protein CCH79_00015199 [Gambusia affinis]|uniref:Uncharacterized protein n=1 Tax=Gambusia affinis TaxID=33528 RepID=A0A315VSC2_GAMAF|nr:hypothetical protein CCH79_00015199 [Gambusia affinis]
MKPTKEEKYKEALATSPCGLIRDYSTVQQDESGRNVRDRHAGIEPPARAVVRAAVSRGIHVIVTVRGGEELLVVVEVLVETDGIPSCSTVRGDSPCAVEADRSVKALLYDGPATTECLHFTENLKCSIARTFASYLHLLHTAWAWRDFPKIGTLPQSGIIQNSSRNHSIAPLLLAGPPLKIQFCIPLNGNLCQSLVRLLISKDPIAPIPTALPAPAFQLVHHLFEALQLLHRLLQQPELLGQLNSQRRQGELVGAFLAVLASSSRTPTVARGLKFHGARGGVTRFRSKTVSSSGVPTLMLSSGKISQATFTKVKDGFELLQDTLKSAQSSEMQLLGEAKRCQAELERLQVEVRSPAEQRGPPEEPDGEVSKLRRQLLQAHNELRAAEDREHAARHGLQR